MKNSGLLIKRVRKTIKYEGEKQKVSETIKYEGEEQKAGFLSMLLGTLGASLLVNILRDKCRIRAGEGTIRAGQDF